MTSTTTTPRFLGAEWTRLLALTAVLITAVGCPPPSAPARRDSAPDSARRQASQSAALLRSAVTRLRDLPNAIDLDLKPPLVVLDGRSSTNGEDILATIGFTPGEEASGLNKLTARTENAGFGRVVEAGDTVKCYLLPDSESRTRIQETGDLSGSVLTHEAVELTVAQVLGPNELRLEKGLRIPVRIAQQLVSDLDRATVGALEGQGIVNADGILFPPEVLQQLAGVAWPFRLEVWRVEDEILDIDLALDKYADRGEPAFGWEVSGDVVELDQLMQRINPWLRGRDQPDDWAPSALLSTVDAELRAGDKLADYLSDDALRRPTFADYEGRLVQEAIWLRDVSRWASGDRFDPVERATRLFDWVVRNVALSDDLRVTSNRPWQTLLAGRGGPAQRAWVFAGLCRQQSIPMAVIELPTGGDEAPWLWCAVYDNQKGSGQQLYLFDPQLGMPVPADPEGKTAATLSGLLDDPSLLRRLDLPDAPYPVTAESLESCALKVVAEPMSLSWRAAEFQTQLRGDDALVLSVDADELASRFAELGLGDVGLWGEPFDFYRRRVGFGPNARNAQRLEFRPFAWRPVLWQARTLHFRGLYETEQEAKKKAEREGDALYEAVNDHQKAARRYMDRSVRPSDARLLTVQRDKIRVYYRAKVDATYWLGLLKYEQGDYKPAKDWLENDALASPVAKHRTHGVRYNLARTLEAMGDVDAAADLLDADDSPQRHGNRLRARLLRGEKLTAAGKGQGGKEADEPEGEQAEQKPATDPPAPAEEATQDGGE